MADEIQDSEHEYGRVTLTHHATSSERAAMLKRRPGPRSRRPECLVIGHSWTEDPARHGGSICITCQVVRWP